MDLKRKTVQTRLCSPLLVFFFFYPPTPHPLMFVGGTWQTISSAKAACELDRLKEGPNHTNFLCKVSVVVKLKRNFHALTSIVVESST